jgi:hypothetical protein
MRKAKPRKAVDSALTLADVTEGDAAVLASGASVEVGFFLGASCFVRFSDNHEPRAISPLPSSTAVVSVSKRARVAAASSEVADPLDRRGK